MKVFPLVLLTIIGLVYADHVPRAHQFDLQVSQKQHLLR